MKKYYILLVLSIGLFISCDDSESAPANLSVEGKHYALTNYILSKPVDLNGDGIYSFDIFDELSVSECQFYSIFFKEDGKVTHPGWGFGIRLLVEEDEWGTLTQEKSCGFLDGLLSPWEQDSNIINIFNSISNDFELNGIVSDDGELITFDAPFNLTSLFFLGDNKILTESGDVIDYQDDVTIIYTLSPQ